ncbi:MAG: hypothetical protein M3N54_06610 [Acidobacteriota bacterium]|nr:hypothetical protein [Acidobacteriota bacterium]
MPNNIDLQVLLPGDPAKANPYTICFAANTALETPWQSFSFSADPMPLNSAAFDAAVRYSIDCLFGNLPGQAEQLLSDLRIAPFVRIVSLRVTGLAVSDANSLVGESPLGQLLAPRRTQMAAFVNSFGITADVIFAVSQSSKYTRESAYPTTDDDTGPGDPFQLDGAARSHRHNFRIPGTVALHVSSRSLTPLHEFGHAASSFTNGQITDLYVDSPPALNCKTGRPIPISFGTLDTLAALSDPTRDGLGYPPGWRSYHCELINPSLPAVMDDYINSGNALACRHDAITRRFLTDRIVAKINR